MVREFMSADIHTSDVSSPSRSWFSAALLLFCLAGAAALAIWPPGGKSDWEVLTQQGLRRGALAAAVVFAGLLLSFPWWGKGGSRGEQSARVITANGHRGFCLGLALAVAAGALLRWHFAHGSMWWDELWNVRNTVVGEFRPDPKEPGTSKFREPSFKRALWYYNKPANHPPVSLLSKGTHEIWRKLRGAPEGAFSEFVLRLPVLLAGLTGLGLTGALLRRWGHPLAGLVAAFLLAMHPWAIRYSVDLRAYGFLLLLAPLGAWAVTKLVESPGRLRWWWLFGFLQFLLLWFHLLSLYLAAAFFATAAVLIWKSQPAGPDRRRLLGRLVAVNAFGAALWCLAMLPCLYQAMQWQERNQDSNTLTFSYLLSTLSQISFGVEPEWPILPETQGLVSLSTLAGGFGWLAVLVLFILAIIGGRTLWRTHRPAGVLFLFISLFAALFLVIVAQTGFYFYHRFVVGLAFPFAALVALGAAGSLAEAGQSVRRAGLVLQAVALLICYGALVFPQIQLLLHRSYTPWNEAARALRAEEVAGNKIRVIGLGHGGDALRCYYPNITEVKDDLPEAIAKAATEAAAANEPLYVCLGYPALHAEKLPKSLALVRNEAQFTRVWEQFGIEPEFTVRIYRYFPTPKPAL